MKHTPAPWKYIGHRINSQAEVNVFTICEIYHRNPEAIANARLIEKSPELLEALIWMVDEFEQEDHNRAYPNCNCESHRRYNHARNLITHLSQE